MEFSTEKYTHWPVLQFADTSKLLFNNMDWRSVLVALNLLQMAPHPGAAQKKVVGPLPAPCQNGKDYSCFTYDQKRSGRNYLQTSVIFTIWTQCYTQRTLHGRRTAEESEVPLPQSRKTPFFVMRGPVSSAMPLQPCKQTVPEPHMTTYYHTSQQGWVRSLLFPSLQCQKQILQRYLYRCGITF